MDAKTILITGAGSGIGRGIAVDAARKGHTIMVTDLDEKAAAQTVEQIRQTGGEGDAFRLDVIVCVVYLLKAPKML
ncbi:MAG: SDR family NAD(P)-dependent oxidoreductase [Fibrobacteres bacterium]|nr:SDR family NAD(P)-dependent oxidoreductase [Fibrobacterota bacterium]